MRKKKEAQEKADLELAQRDPWWAQHFADKKARSSRHKRKKKRKKRLPRSSTLPRRVSACTSGAGEDWRIYPVFPQYPLVRVPSCSSPWSSLLSRIMEILQLLLVLVVDVPVVPGRAGSQLRRFQSFLVRQRIHVTSVYSGFCGRLLKMFRFPAQCLVRHWISEMTSWSLLVFSTMLGSTVALGNDFVELLVFSTLLGSTVALGDDFVEMVVFSALLGSTLDAILGDTSSLYSALEARQWTHGAASLRGHSTGAALGQGCRARCVRGK